MTFPYSFCSATLSWAGGTYLVCNGSITSLKKSFKLTSWADIYLAKWPTQAVDYQKIKRDIAFFFSGKKLKWNKNEQSIGYANIPRCPLTDCFPLFH